MYGQFIFNERAKNTQERKDSAFNKWCWKTNGYLHANVLNYTPILYYL